MIPRYRTQLVLSSGDEAVGRNALVSHIERWVSEVERYSLPPLGGVPVRFQSGAEASLLEFEGDGRSLHVFRYARPISGLLWTTEVGFEPRVRDTLVCVGLSSATKDPVERRGRTFPPRIVGTLVKEFQAAAGMPLTDKPIDIVTDDDVSALVNLLSSRDRILPVMCATVDQFTEGPRTDPDLLQRRLIGLAQVVVLHKRAGFRFTQTLKERLGSREAANRWSVYDGATRVYWPGIDFGTRGADPFRHRLWFPGTAPHEREAFENEAFDVLAWAAVQRDERDWIDSALVQRHRDRHAVEDERAKASADAGIYEEVCKNLEVEKEGLEARLREAVERAEEAEGARNSLEYQYRAVTAQLTEHRKRLPDEGGSEGIPDDAWTVVCYRRGGDRDCVDEAAASDEERIELRERLPWLAHPASWANPAGRLENLRDGVFEYRVNVKDHWYRLFVARLGKLRTVVILHAFQKKSNDLPPSEIKVASDRLRDLV